MPAVTISDELFKRLQQYAVPLVDTLDDLIERALDALDRDNGNVTARPPGGSTPPRSDLVSYVGRVPHGTSLRMVYKGVEYFAEVQDGKVVWNGKRFKSLSDAAVAVIRSTGSDRPTENGWRVWQAQDRTGGWTPLMDLRDGWRQ